jgi:hypothetical protein
VAVLAQKWIALNPIRSKAIRKIKTLKKIE